LSYAKLIALVNNIQNFYKKKCCKNNNKYYLTCFKKYPIFKTTIEQLLKYNNGEINENKDI